MDSLSTDEKTSPDLSSRSFRIFEERLFEDIARELAGEVVFPTCFDVMLRLREVLGDPDASLHRIGQVIGGDPLVCSKLLGIANSAAFNPGGQEITEIGTAIQMLGLNLVQSAAMAVVMKQLLLSRGLAEFDAVMQQLWEHSLLTASAAQVLARRLTRLSPDDAFLAGLVHDLGVYYMLYRANRYAELRARPEALWHLVLQWHESIGESLLDALGLPEKICLAIRDHDQPRPLPTPLASLSDTLYVANILAGGILEWLMKDIDAAERKRSELSEEQRALLPEIKEHFAGVRAAFAV